MANNEHKSWQSELSNLLTRAAKLGVDHGIDMEPFVRDAVSAYIEASPGMREALEEERLKETLAEMRKRGRIARA